MVERQIRKWIYETSPSLGFLETVTSEFGGLADSVWRRGGGGRRRRWRRGLDP